MEQLSKTIEKRRWEQDMIDDQQRIRTVCDCGICTGELEIDAEELVEELRQESEDSEDDENSGMATGFVCENCSRTWLSMNPTKINGETFCPECVDE